MFLLLSILQQLLWDKLDISFRTLFTGMYSPCACLTSLSSVYYTSHLTALFLSHLHIFSCSLLSNYMLINWGSPGSRVRYHWQDWRPEFIVPLSTSLPACLPPWFTHVVMHADECKVIQQENENVGVGVTQGRKEGCGTALFNLERKTEWSEHRSFLPDPLSSAWEVGLLCSSPDEREARSCIYNPLLLNCWECSTKWGKSQHPHKAAHWKTDP